MRNFPLKDLNGVAVCAFLVILNLLLRTRMPFVQVVVEERIDAVKKCKSPTTNESDAEDARLDLTLEEMGTTGVGVCCPARSSSCTAA